MRILHRYLGFFLVGIMSIYAISGTIMTFRDTDFLKSQKSMERQLKPGIAAKDLGKALEQRNLKVTKEDSSFVYFENGEYNKETGFAKFSVKEWPEVVIKLTNLHKSRSGEPLFFFNLFFALSLFFFVISSFWMFPVQSANFKKGIIYVVAGLVLATVLVLLKKA